MTHGPRMSGALNLLAAVPNYLPHDDWTYRTANTKQLTHGIHPYPAMMIPQIARRLISTYGRKGEILFDPYCGSGTTLLEGMLAGMETVGTDLNPLARLIARVKTTPVNIAALNDAIAQFPASSASTECAIPLVTNIDYWFSPDVQRDLAAIRQHINDIDDPMIANVFRVAFSLTVRQASWTRKSEFKLHRLPVSQMRTHNPKPFSIMAQALAQICAALQDLNSAVSGKAVLPSIEVFNTVQGVPSNAITRRSVYLVVSSPPYGDSRTTVAYGQFSRFASQWLGFADANRLDNQLMGGDTKKRTILFDIAGLDGVIDRIAQIDRHRSIEVSSFFEDYRRSIGNVSALVARGGYACFVVGNRTVKGCVVPTAEVTAAFFERNGFVTEDVCTREIPNKRMPSVNSPSNIAGQRGKTMTTEQIVICRKVE